MIKRMLGNTGLEVPILGLGAGEIGDWKIEGPKVDEFLNTAVDLGITLLDTARSYGASEERIGRYLRYRRKDFLISTKVGYGIEGILDWTYDAVRAGINEALIKLQSEYIDIVHLHSCPLETLQQGDVIAALQDAVNEGKVRVAAYSGENDELDFAVTSRRFGSVQTSINICDQRVIGRVLPYTIQNGIGVIAKRPIANAPWRFSEAPARKDVEEYWWRWKTMKLDPGGLDWTELSLRFAAYTPGVHSCIAGTANLDHLLSNVAMIEKGPLRADLYNTIRAAFAANDPGWWIGQI
jgi:aryl-alcohol dehydrogenase-like predicted oxidoreductase